MSAAVGSVPGVLTAVAVAVALAAVGLIAFNTWVASKYRAARAAASAAGRDRSFALSPLRAKPASMAPARRLLRDGPAQAPLEHFTSGLGLNIIVYSWRAYAGKRPPKAVVLFLHGLDSCAEADLSLRLRLPEHKGYVGSWAESLNDAGYLVYSFDYNGMGHSESVVDGVRTMCCECRAPPQSHSPATSTSYSQPRSMHLRKRLPPAHACDLPCAGAPLLRRLCGLRR